MEERDITPLLQKAYDGDSGAMSEIVLRIQNDLERMAAGKIRAEFAGRPVTLAPQDLVQETFQILLSQRNEFKNREHLFAVATKLMSRALKDYQKSRSRIKRGGPEKIMVTLGAADRRGGSEHLATFRDLANAMDQLEEEDSRLAQVFKLREVWGLSSQEVADSLGVSKSTVDRDWRFARAWLRRRLEA